MIKKDLEQNQNLQVKIDDAIRKVRALDRMAKEELDELKNTALATIDPLLKK